MPNSDDNLVRRCVCGDVSFEALLDLGVATLEDAAQHGCGVNCGLCRPYLQAMIETGETAFAVDQARG